MGSIEETNCAIHMNGNCRCNQKLMQVGEDESVYSLNSFTSCYWTRQGRKKLLPKGDKLK